MTDAFNLKHLCATFKLPYGNHDGKQDSISCMYLLDLIIRCAPVNLNTEKLLIGKKWVNYS
jgi:hypothetical protein